MKRFFLFLLLTIELFCVCGTSVYGETNIPKNPNNLGTETLKVVIPQPEIWTLENGLTVYYLRDSLLPLVRGKLYVRGGAYFEPEDLVGLAAATGTLLREGSIEGVSPDDFDFLLDGLGASIESRFGNELGSVDFTSVEEDFEHVFELFSKVVQTPAFNKERLEVWRKLALDGVLKRRDDPDLMAEMTFVEVVFGKGSPYSRATTAQSLKKITAESMRSFYKRFFQPKGAYLVVTGDISREKVEAVVSKYFSSWKGNDSEMPPFPQVTHQVVPGIYVLERDFDQARIIIGHQGPPRFPEDLYAIFIYNRTYLNGSYGSVIFSEIRSKKGLAYFAGGGIDPGRERGIFQIDIGTRNEETLNAVSGVLEILKRSREQLPPKSYFEDAKLATRNSYVFKFSSPHAVTCRAAELDILGYPKDYDQQYLNVLPTISSEGVKGVARHWIQPESVAIVVVGDVKAADVKASIGGSVPVFKVDFDTEPTIIGPIL